MSLEKVPLPTIVSISPLDIVNWSVHWSRAEKSIRNRWVGRQVHIVDGEDVVFRVGTELAWSADMMLKSISHSHIQRVLPRNSVLRLINQSMLIATEERSGGDSGGGEDREEESGDPHDGELVSCKGKIAATVGNELER